MSPNPLDDSVKCVDRNGRVVALMYIITDNYVDYALVNIRSVLINNPERRFTVFFLYRELSDESKSKLSSFVYGKWGQTAEFIHVDVSLFKGLNYNDYIPPELYYKIIPHTVLPENLHVVIYIDIDMIIDGSLEEVFDLSMDDNTWFYACRDYPAFKQLLNGQITERDDYSNYVNSGFLVVNLDGLRKANVTLESYKESLKTPQGHLFEE